MEALQDRGLMGDYHLLIAPKVLEEPAAHEDFYRRIPRATVIMDNGVIETDDPGDAEMLIEAARLVNADWTVLPDVPDDAVATLQLAVDAAEIMAPALRSPLIGVIQGTDIKTLLKCAKGLQKHIPTLGAIGVPRSLIAHIGSRTEITMRIVDELKLPVHLLGISNDLLDDLYTANTVPEVMGLDSAAPVYSDQLMNLVDWEKTDRPHNYWQWHHFTQTSSQNIRRMRGWLTGVNYVPTVREEPLLSEAPDEAIVDSSSSEKSRGKKNEELENPSSDQAEDSSGNA